ncbi:MAG: HAD-IG family 5'-nucleotidase [bacterium]
MSARPESPAGTPGPTVPALGGAPPERGIFCNRTLNLRAIRAIGYDMDYTLIHYLEEEWERRAYAHTRARLVDRGWPVADLEFDSRSVVRGLTIDLELGNLVKPNRFGYVIKAAHGTRILDFDEMRSAYSGTFVDLSDPRFVFLNTLFSYSEAWIYSQLVDLLDRRELPEVLGYAELYDVVRHTLDEAHMEGTLKGEIIAAPDRFVVLDEEAPLALLDQKHAGKKLLLITNSEWEYTRSMMAYAFDRFLPERMTWRDLFDIVIVSARKPSFFSARNPLFEVVDEDRGLLQPAMHGLEKGGVFFGGNASLVEKHLGLSGEEILYVGDHLFGDVHVSKDLLRWRTALVLREMEQDVRELHAFRDQQTELSRLMHEKEELEREICRLRVLAQRKRRDYGPDAGNQTAGDPEGRLTSVRDELVALDERIAPIAKAASELGNPIWGSLMRAGNDKSLFARQVERYADVYLSRVSNFLYETPFAFLRAARPSLPHDPLA